jgi:hypothetical protein
MLLIVAYLVYVYIVACTLVILFRRSWLTHKEAFHKFVVLWLISTLPIFFAFLFSKNDDGKGFSSFFTLHEQFVYAAAFLAPVLYVFYDAIKVSWESEKRDRWEEFKENIRGYERLFFPSVVLILVTAVAYASAKQDAGSFEGTVFFVTFSHHNWIIYGLAMLLWYTAILLETPTGKPLPEAIGDEVDKMREAAKAAVEGDGGNA